MKLQYSLLSLLVASALTACGGSNDATPTISLTGKVADGYLVNATVCLDLNKNKICDTNEPSAVSTDGGAFTLAQVTPEQIAQYPLLVQIIENKTIDEDNPGIPLTQAYTLSAPAGFTFVSPLTTIVQNEVEKGSTIKQAEQLIKTKLGTSVGFDDDYIAGKTANTASDKDKAEFEKLHKVAQVAANVIASNMALLKETAATAGITVNDLVSLIVDEVFGALTKITQQVELVNADNTAVFDANLIATSIDTQFIAIKQETLAEKIEQKEAEANASITNLITLIKTEGINWFSGEMEDQGAELAYGTVTLDANNVVHDAEYSWMNNQWVAHIPSHDINEWILTATGWIAYDDSIETVTLNTDNSITLNHPALAQLSETITGVEVNISGLNASLLMQKTDRDRIWAKALPADIVFPAGSIGYKLNFRQAEEHYVFNEWGDCQVVNQLGDLCNTIWHQKGTGNFSDDGSTETLAEMVVTTPLDITGTAEDLTRLNGIHIGWMENGNLVAELLEGGTINFYKVNFSTLRVEKLTTGSWSDITVHGKTLRKIMGPNFLSEFDGFFDNDQQIILFEHLGGVRIGWQKGLDASDNDEFVFNSIARDFILANFNVALVTE